MIYVLYTKIIELADQKFIEYLNLLPNKEIDKITNLIRWQDKMASLLGRLLLIEGLILLNKDPKLITQIQYNKYRRPHLPIDIDFNIAHSGKYVVLAISKYHKVGVDIEHIKKLDLDIFKRIINIKNWELINNSENRYKEFYRYWTMLESVLKASGCGFISHKSGFDLQIEDNKNVFYNDSNWFLHELAINSKYCSCLATHEYDVKLKIIEIPNF